MQQRAVCVQRDCGTQVPVNSTALYTGKHAPGTWGGNTVCLPENKTMGFVQNMKRFAACLLWGSFIFQLEQRLIFGRTIVVVFGSAVQQSSWVVFVVHP